MTCLRLVLGDQLDLNHIWFRRPDLDIVVVMMEMRQETDYVWHHAQKIIAFFASMRRFAEQLRERGHRVDYLRIDAPENRQSLPANLDEMALRHRATRLEYQEPDEYRLDRQLDDYARRASIPVLRVPSDHFYTSRLEARDVFGARRHWLLDRFYRRQRTRHGILMDAHGKPIGARWSFDADNRRAWRGEPAEPVDARPTHDHSRLWRTIQAAGVRALGDPRADQFRWPLDRDAALGQLSHFVEHALPWFGDYQDAMSENATRLFHSLISYALNTKMLNPREVVSRTIEAYEAGQAPLNAVEGFVRQILGWREYVRGVYWARMPNYALNNFFEHRRPLPAWYWTGKTRMRCMAASIGQSLQHAHAHHIQRLMVIGNFALLAGIDPSHVHRWYLGIYIDAVEWVELPNTLGLSQYADGGLLATKPYISAAAYIDRMSDYCNGCYYRKAQRTGAQACPFNALYWAFLLRHRKKLSGVSRLALAYKNLSSWSAEESSAVNEHADTLLRDIDQL